MCYYIRDRLFVQGPIIRVAFGIVVFHRLLLDFQEVLPSDSPSVATENGSSTGGSCASLGAEDTSGLA